MSLGAIIFYVQGAAMNYRSGFHRIIPAPVAQRGPCLVDRCGLQGCKGSGLLALGFSQESLPYWRITALSLQSSCLSLWSAEIIGVHDGIQFFLFEIDCMWLRLSSDSPCNWRWLWTSDYPASTPKCWNYKKATMPTFCSAEDHTQDTMHSINWTTASARGYILWQTNIVLKKKRCI